MFNCFLGPGAKTNIFIMKKFGLILIALSLSATTMLTTSCSKEQGCTDPDSKNYSATAEEDDGSCAYEGEVVFWYNKITSENLYDDGSDALTFYVDGKVVGSSNANVYWGSAPSCGDNASITVTKDLGNIIHHLKQLRMGEEIKCIVSKLITA